MHQSIPAVPPPGGGGGISRAFTHIYYRGWGIWIFLLPQGRAFPWDNLGAFHILVVFASLQKRRVRFKLHFTYKV